MEEIGVTRCGKDEYSKENDGEMGGMEDYGEEEDVGEKDDKDFHGENVKGGTGVEGSKEGHDEECGSEEVVFIVTDQSSSQVYEMVEVREDELMEDNEIAAIAAQEHEMKLALQEDCVDFTDEDEGKKVTMLSHLTKREFTKQVELQFPTELSVLKLRDKLADDIRAVDKTALNGSLLTRAGTKRMSSMSRYISDCYTLQRYIDGDEIIDIDTLLSKPPTRTQSKLHTHEFDSNSQSIQLKALSTSNKATSSKSSVAMGVSGKALSVLTSALKTDRKVIQMKSKLKNVKQNNIEKTAKLHGTIKGLRDELKQLKQALKEMQKSRETGEVKKLEMVDMGMGEDDEQIDEHRITYYISEEEFTNRGGRKLIASDGNTFIIKRITEKNGVQTLLWRCHRRFRNCGCPATVKQRGNIFLAGLYDHNHEDFPDFNLYAAGISKEDLLTAGDGTSYTKDLGGGCIKEFKFECPSCEARFIFRKHMEEHHLQIHGARYLCFDCSKGFSDHATYKEHRLCVHTDDRQFTCNVCGKQFHMKKTLTKHAKTHGPRIRDHICYDCGKAYHSADILTKHMKSHSIPHHLCTTCGKLFKTKNHLRSHINIHTRERVYRCNWCEKEFTHPSHLLIHARRHHTGERPYPCSYCEKRYVSKSECKEHERVHTGIRRVKKVKSEDVVAPIGKRKVIHTGQQHTTKKERKELQRVEQDFLIGTVEEHEYASNVLNI